MAQEPTTLAVQRYLDGLADDPDRDQIVCDLLGRAVHRLRILCASYLHKSYPRLKRAPVNLRPDELLSSVAARLLKALKQVRPKSVRQFFALANQHIRWELIDLARRLDHNQFEAELPDGLPAPPASDSCLSTNSQRILEAIDNLPVEEREVFSLNHIQGLPQTEIAEILGVTTKTVQRRLNRALLQLADRLHDLAPR